MAFATAGFVDAVARVCAMLSALRRQCSEGVPRFPSAGELLRFTQFRTDPVPSPVCGGKSAFVATNRIVRVGHSARERRREPPATHHRGEKELEVRIIRLRVQHHLFARLEPLRHFHKVRVVFPPSPACVEGVLVHDEADVVPVIRHNRLGRNRQHVLPAGIESSTSALIPGLSPSGTLSSLTIPWKYPTVDRQLYVVIGAIEVTWPSVDSSPMPSN